MVAPVATIVSMVGEPKRYPVKTSGRARMLIILVVGVLRCTSHPTTVTTNSTGFYLTFSLKCGILTV